MLGAAKRLPNIGEEKDGELTVPDVEQAEKDNDDEATGEKLKYSQEWNYEKIKSNLT